MLYIYRHQNLGLEGGHFTPAELAQSAEILSQVDEEIRSYGHPGVRELANERAKIEGNTRKEVTEQQNSMRKGVNASKTFMKIKDAVNDILEGNSPMRWISEYKGGEEGFIDYNQYLAIDYSNKTLNEISPLKSNMSTATEVNYGPANNVNAIIQQIPERWRPMMQKILGKKPRSGGDAINEMDLINAPAIFLSDTSSKKGCVYIKGEFLEFPIISNSNSIKGVTKYTQMRYSSDAMGDASVTGSSTVLGCALTGPGLSAKWIHGVDPIRIPASNTAGCIGVNTHDMVRIGKKLTNHASLITSKTRPGKKHKTNPELESKTATQNLYDLNFPVINYTV